MLGIAESKPLPPNYGYGMTGNFPIPIPENVLTRESPVVQQNMHLMDKLGRVPVMPVTLPAPLEKPTPSQALIWPAQKPEGPQESVLVDPFAVKKEEILANPFATKPDETLTDPFADKTNETPADPFADKPEETPEDPFADKPEETLSDPFANKPKEISTLPDPFTKSKAEESSSLPNPFTENNPKETSVLPDPFTESKPEESSSLPNPFTENKPETSILPDPFTENKPETSILPDSFTEHKPESLSLPNPFTDNKPESSVLSDPFTENKPESSSLPNPFNKSKPETSVLPDPFIDNKSESSTLPNPFNENKPEETSILPDPFTGNKSEESSSLPNPFTENKPETSPLPESTQEEPIALSDPFAFQPSPSDDLFASLSPTPDTRQQEIDTIFDTSNTSMLKRPSQTLAEIRASSTLSKPESQQPAEDPFANVSTPVGEDLFMGMTSHETPEPEILTDMSNPEIITETTDPEKPTETPIPEIFTEGKPLSRLTPGTLLPADSPEDLRKAAEAIGVNMEEPETPTLMPHEVHAVDVVKYFQEDDELGSDEDDGKRLRILFDNMLPVVNENPVIPEPEEMAEQVICKARALLTMLDSLSVPWTQQKKKKRLVNQVKKILDERCYSEIGYDIKVCEK